VDEIVVYATEKDLMDVLQSFPIDVRIIGEEYKHKSFTGKELPIEIYYNKRRHSFSTSELRQRVVEREKVKNESSNNNGSTLRS
jgi:glycerol-3-phosphate cytidylyltransferase